MVPMVLLFFYNLTNTSVQKAELIVLAILLVASLSFLSVTVSSNRLVLQSQPLQRLLIFPNPKAEQLLQLPPLDIKQSETNLQH